MRNRCTVCLLVDPLHDFPRCTRPDCPARLGHDRLDDYEGYREQLWREGEDRADRLHRYNGIEGSILWNIFAGLLIIGMFALVVWAWML